MSNKPVEFEAVKPQKVMVDREERKKTSHHKLRGLRWVGVKAKANKTLSKVIDVEKHYNFPLY